MQPSHACASHLLHPLALTVSSSSQRDLPAVLHESSPAQEAATSSGTWYQRIRVSLFRTDILHTAISVCSWPLQSTVNMTILASLTTEMVLCSSFLLPQSHLRYQIQTCGKYTSPLVLGLSIPPIRNHRMHIMKLVHPASLTPRIPREDMHQPPSCMLTLGNKTSKFASVVLCSTSGRLSARCWDRTVEPALPFLRS